MRNLKKATIVMAAFIMTTSSVAATGTGAAAPLPAGTTAAVEQSVTAPVGNVTDGNFSFTMEQTMILGDRIGFVYSVEGVTEAAKAQLLNEEFDYDYTVKLPAGSGIEYDYKRFGEMKDLRTETKKFFYGLVEIEANPQGLPLSVGLNAITKDVTYISTPANDEGTVFSLTKAVAAGKDELYIPIPMDKTGIELALDVPTASGINTVVELSPLDVSVSKAPTAATEDIFSPNVSFRLEDGSLKGIDECYFIDSFGPNEEYTYRGMARTVQDLSKVKAIIVDGQEYSVAQ